MLRLTGRCEGSALMLVPAGVLVLIVLGAIAVDSAVIFLAQRDLASRTAAVANDAVTLAVDDAVFYREGTVALRPGTAHAYALATFAPANRPDGYVAWGVTTSVEALTVEVNAWAEVRSIFLRALPGAPATTRVEATSVATGRGSR